MKERPILFSAPMVRAILAGGKTVTRRVVKLPEIIVEPGEPEATSVGWIESHESGPGFYGWMTEYPEEGSVPIRCPYGQPGDRLIVAMEIPGVGRAYCAGSDGVIYSRARGDWRPLKAHANGNGYLCVTIMDGARKTTRAVHSLVCSAFYGAAPFAGAQVRHLDGDPQRCEPANLAWGTQAENWRDRRAHGNGAEGEKHHAAKLSDAERAHLRWAIARGLCSQRHASRALGMSQSAIAKLLAGAETRQVEQDAPVDRIPHITLEVTGVRVERLQEISEADAKSEGCCTQTYRDGRGFEPATLNFERLWNQINGAGSWEANPWVWCISFRRIEQEAAR